jgi:hypothetical protein
MSYCITKSHVTATDIASDNRAITLWAEGRVTGNCRRWRLPKTESHQPGSSNRRHGGLEGLARLFSGLYPLRRVFAATLLPPFCSDTEVRVARAGLSNYGHRERCTGELHRWENRASMNASGASILANPHPCGHIVYPYTDEGLLGQAVSLFTSAGLRDGDGVILIISADHCESIKLRLQLEGINPEAYEATGQLVFVMAEDLLRTFVPNGTLDEQVFTTTVANLITRTKQSATPARRVRVFGEMVSELRTNDPAATTRLEELWNDVVKEHAVSLLCTYALHHAGDSIPAALIHLHTAKYRTRRRHQQHLEKTGQRPAVIDLPTGKYPVMSTAGVDLW